MTASPKTRARRKPQSGAQALGAESFGVHTIERVPRADTDVPRSVRKTTHSFVKNRENKAMFRAKLEAMKIIQILMDYRLSVRLQHLINDFKLVRGREVGVSWRLLLSRRSCQRF